MKITKFIIIVVLIFYFSINLGSASNINELPIDVQLKDESIPWSSDTIIITPFGDQLKVEINYHFHVPMHSADQFFDVITVPGTLESDIELYINNEKKDFNESFYVVSNKENFSIKSDTSLKVINTTDIKFTFLNKQPSDVFSFKNNSVMVQFTTINSIIKGVLFNQIIFRIPTVNAQNINIDFHNSIFKNSENILTGAPISKIFATDKYIDVSYIFWNDNMVNQIIESNRLILTKIPENDVRKFQTQFVIEYDTVRVDWIIESIIVAILLTITFYLGKYVKEKA